MTPVVPTRPACSIDGCDRPRVARGWCKLHYARWHQTGTPDAPPQAPECSVELCKRRGLHEGMCLDHYDRWVRTGDTGPVNAPLGWVNPLVCVCEKPDADRRRDFGMCQRCKRKPLALMAAAS